MRPPCPHNCNHHQHRCRCCHRHLRRELWSVLSSGFPSFWMPKEFVGRFLVVGDPRRLSQILACCVASFVRNAWKYRELQHPRPPKCYGRRSVREQQHRKRPNSRKSEKRARLWPWKSFRFLSCTSPESAKTRGRLSRRLSRAFFCSNRSCFPCRTSSRGAAAPATLIGDRSLPAGLSISGIRWVPLGAGRRVFRQSPALSGPRRRRRRRPSGACWCGRTATTGRTRASTATGNRPPREPTASGFRLALRCRSIVLWKISAPCKQCSGTWIAVVVAAAVVVVLLTLVDHRCFLRF
mmetsp:Transcript_15842/g.32464  ORF Transcript_15842/g.32464 Transcript_15842/m.32464 type:complete len:295 (-) Transcript_15842:990-1874(-)